MRYLHDPPRNLLTLVQNKILTNYPEAALGKQLDASRIQLPFHFETLFADRVEGTPGLYLKRPLTNDRPGIFAVIDYD